MTKIEIISISCQKCGSASLERLSQDELRCRYCGGVTLVKQVQNNPALEKHLEEIHKAEESARRNAEETERLDFLMRAAANECFEKISCGGKELKTGGNLFFGSYYLRRKPATVSIENGSIVNRRGEPDEILPLEWRILSNDGKELFLLCERVIEQHPFYVNKCKENNDDNRISSWASSNVREWLNKDFFNAAFSDKEKMLIIKSRISENAQFKLHGQYARHGQKENEFDIETFDSVFLLSISEAAELGGDQARMAKVTPYSEKLLICNEEGYTMWFLRTALNDGWMKCAAAVDDDGAIKYRVSEWQYQGIRPAIKVKLI